ncbi:replication initiator [Streptomyces sp. NPDC088175]|uniref:replication initiator n=1 Tax=unclassified Streptomyces TaxID=2593676 RepID=UPI0038218FA1
MRPADPARRPSHRTEIYAVTGEILSELKSKELPAGHLLVRCGNRRTTRCPSCAELYRQDTYHLIAAGLRGGKNIPEQVATHPRVFTTLTAPSYGPVHGRRTAGSSRCRCGHTHTKEDPRLCTPLAPERYHYTGPVLWNAHAPALWARFMLHLRRTIAAAVGVPQRLLHKVVRVSYAKVAEYQQHRLIHFHAVIRLDGPTGPYTPPPAWATPELLADAIRLTATRAHIDGPEINSRTRSFVFGEQIGTRIIRSTAFQGGTTITEGKVARYVAKGTEAATGTLDRQLKRITGLWSKSVPEHAACMIRAAWHRRHTPPPSPTTLVLAHWVYDGTGLTPDLERLAALIGGGPARRQEVTANA